MFRKEVRNDFLDHSFSSEPWWFRKTKLGAFQIWMFQLYVLFFGGKIFYIKIIQWTWRCFFMVYGDIFHSIEPDILTVQSKWRKFSWYSERHNIFVQNEKQNRVLRFFIFIIYVLLTVFVWFYVSQSQRKLYVDMIPDTLNRGKLNCEKL